MVCKEQSAVTEQVFEVDEGAALLEVALLVAEVDEGVEELDETADQACVEVEEDPILALTVTSGTYPVNLGL